MPLRGDTAAIRAQAEKLGGFKAAGSVIATLATPKVAARVQASAASQTTPYGASWLPSKSGAPVLRGAASEIEVKLLAGGKTIRVRLLYPLGFHDDGTHVVGRKRGRAIRQKIVGARARLAAAAYGKAPRKRKDETEDQYDARMSHLDVIRAVKAEARQQAGKEVAAAIASARSTGGVHDPARPLVPNDAEGIPPGWVDDFRAIARKVLEPMGAVER